MWPPLNRVGAEFIGDTRKERPCFAAERGLDRLGHTSLRMVYWGGFTASGTQASGWFIGGTRKERRCFAAERGPNRFGHTRALEGSFSDPKIWAPRCRGLGSSSPASPFRDLEIEAGFCHVKFFS